jgi:molybdopterin synthase catalytic subunit
LSEPAAGALVVFEGWVRNENEGRPVTGLFYEAEPKLCARELEKIAGEAKAKFGVFDVRVAHRVGQLAIGDMAVWVGVTAGHRDAAFAGCRYVIDELKKRLPIWKKEFYDAGNDRWIGA